jgi:tripartite-type tricarboxylate transporter receptor subunit TctC
MSTRRDTLKRLALLTGAATHWVTPAAWAQAFPIKPVRIVTPFPSGSGPDTALRLVAERLTKKWGQPVIIENKPGGNGFIAIAAFKLGAADGHDLIQLDSNHITTHPHTFSKLPYDVERDLAPVRMLLRTPFFVAVGVDSPYKTLDELIAGAKARPGKLTYGSWFNGSPGHIGALRLQSMKGLQMLHVPYRDFGQLYASVATGDVDWALASIASAGALERAGKLRFIALAAPKREPAYPDVPATAELASTRGYEVSAWAGLFAPHALPLQVRDRIAADVADALASPEIVERYRMLGYEAPNLNPAAFTELIQRETREWAETIRMAGLRLD